MKQQKLHYLNNANLLREIHNSKLTYCCYEKEEYTKYDIICEDYPFITPNDLQLFFEKNTEAEYIIIRVMDSEHVIDFCKNRKVNLQDLKMHPFKHFLLLKSDFETVFKSVSNNMKIIQEDADNIKKKQLLIKDNNKNIRFNKLKKENQAVYKEHNETYKAQIDSLRGEIKKYNNEFMNNIKPYLKEVLRSHWKGKTIEDGYFDNTQGQLSNDLVKMMMQMVDNYARSGNWSGYSFLSDMKSDALVHLCDVALKFEESKSSNVFSYLTQIISMKFTANLNSEKVQSKIKSQMMQSIGYNPTYSEMIDEELAQRNENNQLTNDINIMQYQSLKN